MPQVNFVVGVSREMFDRITKEVEENDKLKSKAALYRKALDVYFKIPKERRRRQ